MSDSTAEPVDATREDPALRAAGVQRVCVQLSNAGAKHPLRMRVYKKMQYTHHRYMKEFLPVTPNPPGAVIQRIIAYTTLCASVQV